VAGGPPRGNAARMATDRLVILAARPAAGYVMHGLTPPLPPDDAAAAYEAGLRDVVALAARERARVEIWYEDAARAGRYFEAEFPHVPRVAQTGGELGKRVRDALAWSFAGEARSAIVLWSDAPTLPDGLLTAALSDLREADVVVGPKEGDGYYLIGVRAAAWSMAEPMLESLPLTERPPYRRMIERAAEVGADLRILPAWYGIDGIEALRRARLDAGPSTHLGRWLAGTAARRYIGDQ